MSTVYGTIYARDWALPHEGVQTRVKSIWLRDLNKSKEKHKKDRPNYYWDSPQTLISTSRVHRFSVGTGDDIFASVFPLIEAAEREVVLVTCFWAKSPSLDRLYGALKTLSSKAVARGRAKVTVSICFSSSSLLQKLFHPASPRGKSYGPTDWQQKLGLPAPEDVPGLDLRVKSMFVLPFSVMHPKFVIVDRRCVILPSCNISWETWFEGCVVMSGDVVEHFVQLWEEFWNQAEATPLETEHAPLHETMSLPDKPSFSTCSFNGRTDIPTIFLPSPHHRSPRFRPFYRQALVEAPATPLNTFVLTLLRSATTSIYMQTPNLTSPPVLAALLEALRCGVNVHIVTCDDLMLLEQVVTAGTTTARCIKNLRKRHHALTVSKPGRKRRTLDEETRLSRPGALTVDYFRPRGGQPPDDPVKSHLKLTIVDGEWFVLGSGNMDRASWFTSQELGCAFLSADMAREIKRVVDRSLEGRLERVEG